MAKSGPEPGQSYRQFVAVVRGLLETNPNPSIQEVRAGMGLLLSRARLYRLRDTAVRNRDLPDTFWRRKK